VSPSIRVSLTYAEAEALLDGSLAYRHATHEQATTALRARGKLIGKLFDDPNYIPPSRRETLPPGRLISALRDDAAGS